jgi:hypothetical protein
VASIVLSLGIRDKVSVCRGTRHGHDIVSIIVICDMSLTKSGDCDNEIQRTAETVARVERK